MSKKFFDNDTHAWSDDARQLASEAGRLLRPLYERYMKEGYSPREIDYIINSESNCISLGEVVHKGMEVSKQRKKERELKRQLDNQADDASVKVEAKAVVSYTDDGEPLCRK
jgi:folate-dependent phosphoribosylglycinamide formyltransferase PurN